MSDGPLFDRPRYSGPFLMLDEAAFKRAHADRRARCPTCGQPTTDRFRGLSPKLAKFLIILARHSLASTDGWVHVREVHRAEIGDGEMGGDYGKLRYWYLTEQKPNDTGGNDSGLWRPTDLGLEWLSGETSIPKRVALAEYRMANKVLGHLLPMVTIREVLGDDTSFDWDQLQRDTYAALRRKRG